MKQTQAAAQPADLFDFWLGEWELSWTNADGSPGKGRNRIQKILDGRVIEESFETLSGPKPRLKGRSLSVLHAGTGLWRQTWADNQGGYFSLAAQVEGETRVFQTATARRDGKEIAARMVFHSITRASLIWDWESTSDGGKTWQRQWRVHYKRRR